MKKLRFWLFLAVGLLATAAASAAPATLAAGFGGITWGTPADKVTGCFLLRTDAARELAVYEAPGLDIGSLTGEAKPAGAPLLFFSLKEGLLQGQVELAGERYDAVFRHLANLLGQPVMYELRKSLPPEYLGYDIWFAGDKTRVELIGLLDRVKVVVSRRDIVPLP